MFWKTRKLYDLDNIAQHEFPYEHCGGYIGNALFCRKNPKDPRVLAQLISAYSKVDPAKAQKISRDLPSVDEVVASVDVEALESAFSSLGPKYMRKTQKAEPSPGP